MNRTSNLSGCPGFRSQLPAFGETLLGAHARRRTTESNRRAQKHSTRFPGELLTTRGVLQVDRAEARSEA